MGASIFRVGVAPQKVDQIRALRNAGRRHSALELPRDQAEALLRTAHEVCPYSNATRGNIVVDLKLA